jgi:FkbM family methyltransferase
VYEKMNAFYFNPVADNIPVPTERKVFRELVDEVYVDTGAYIGQTVLDFIRDRASVYKSIYCFEPDRISFKRLSKNLEQYTRNGSSEINLINAAVGDLFKKVSFLHTGTWGSKVVNATNMFNTVDQYALDKYKWNALPTLIKFDIEGNELSALKGANSFIKNSTTVLSITAEHRIEDLWEIPLYLYAINPKRLIYLIPRDYEVGMDLVFYSVPQGRIVI